MEMEILGSYNLIIEASVIIILSFFFGEVARKTNIPSVLMLIVLGILIKFGMDAIGVQDLNFFPHFRSTRHRGIDYDSFLKRP